MNENLIAEISCAMSTVLNCQQLKRLNEVLAQKLNRDCDNDIENDVLLSQFLQAKRVEGRSLKTLDYYEATIKAFMRKTERPLCQISPSEIRSYLECYQATRNSSNVTIDNIRRIFSSFFSWLEEEDYIAKSPVRRIHKVKCPSTIKETISDEDLEALREGCSNLRDRVIVDVLASTGMRVGELVRLDIADVNLAERECTVIGKGDKQRKAYFDARTKVHLEEYIASRVDDNPALFVSLSSPHKRLESGGVELRLRNLGKQLGLSRIHPHKFRRTLATCAIDKGMPIEQVQKLLGHARIDTTMHYALVNQDNVKLSHRKYLG
ncbi:MAG: site-specific tyrosine recombinase/integron integrase [Coriobacteriales bacterium]|jgi:site-specific recombinase XerD